MQCRIHCRIQCRNETETSYSSKGHLPPYSSTSSTPNTFKNCLKSFLQSTLLLRNKLSTRTFHFHHISVYEIDSPVFLRQAILEFLALARVNAISQKNPHLTQKNHWYILFIESFVFCISSIISFISCLPPRSSEWSK